MQKSTMTKKETALRNSKWFIIDATGAVVGKLAVQVANLLRGKNKPSFTPNIDCGDYVIIINASKVNLTGNKLNDKMYYNHSMYPGGLRERNAKTMREKYPVEMLERAVNGMLPHNRLGRAMGKKLFVYEGETHPHTAQKPVTIEIK